ncbi:hypothetical protein [Streptomyces zagrosensis]|uniref:DNA primase n=1 Tax=Streptomyces zagrosensis TaxID=1042984 RepID=A0A7W9Q9Q2_9ACTN|nr:hypothetical protein [Streptomyces zagrosensis]MBB5936141.1 hypothetical protein [Streptomyces zagrosensis]
MINNAKIGVALVGGYALGRTKKAKLALGLGMFLAGKKLGTNPKQLAELAAKSPVLSSLNEQVRGELVDATKSAATSALTRRMTSMADSLHERTLDLDGQRDDDDTARDDARDGDARDDADERDEPEAAEESEESGEADEPADEQPSAGGAREKRTKAPRQTSGASARASRTPRTAKKTASGSARKTASAAREKTSDTRKKTARTPRKTSERGGGRG